MSKPDRPRTRHHKQVTISDLLELASRAFRNGVDWSTFVARHCRDITLAAPTDQAAEQRFRNQLRAVVECGTTQAQIDASTWYGDAESDLRPILGVAWQLVEPARAAGVLPSVAVGDGFAFLGKDLAAWRDAGYPIAAQNTSFSRPTACAAGGFVFHGGTAMKSGVVAQSFEDEVAKEMARGKNRTKATSAVVAKYPALHAAYLDEANGRSSATATGKVYADPIAAWDAAVQAETAKGLNRAKAVRAVAIANPGLHQAFLAASNAARPDAVALIPGRRAIHERVMQR